MKGPKSFALFRLEPGKEPVLMGKPIEYHGFIAELSFDSKSDTVYRDLKTPAPIEGDLERLELWAQVTTGMELDGDGIIGALDAAKWRKRKQRLDRLGGPPK